MRWAVTEMDRFLEWMRHLTWAESAGFFLTVNVVIVALSAGGNAWVRRHAGVERATGNDRTISRSDLAYAASCLGINVTVSVAGWAAWCHGWLPLRPEGGLATPLTLVLMLAVMDFGLFIGHRIAHWGPIYRLAHRRHHEHEDTNVLSLFVLHPLETLAFGALLLTVIRALSPTPLALNACLFVNVLFGTLGHTDVRWPTPGTRLARIVGWLGLDDFHARHHTHPAENFGFYSRLWDRLFRTGG